MLIFPKARLVLLSVPKTGTTAYEQALSDHAGIIVRDPPLLKHAPVMRYNRFFRKPVDMFVGEDVDIVAVMREPISWLGSWYRYRKRPFLSGQPTSTADLSFDDFVDAYLQKEQPAYAHVGTQSTFLTPRNTTRVTHLFRYEDQSGLKRFLENRLELRFETEQHNVSPKSELILSQKLEHRLRRKYAQDFELWNSIGENGDYTALPE